MFEGIILGLIVFAVGYALAMRVMARRADVLHGEFIEPSELHPAVRPNPLIAAVQRYMFSLRLPARH